MTYRNLIIEFGDETTLEYAEVDELGVSVVGFLAIYTGSERKFLNLEAITAYSFDEVEDDKQPNPRDNLTLIQ